MGKKLPIYSYKRVLTIKFIIDLKNRREHQLFAFLEH